MQLYILIYVISIGGNMMRGTRIVVLRLKELKYTMLFFGIGIVLILLLVFIVKPKKEQAAETTGKYTAGIYTAQLELNNTALNLEVILNTDKISSIRLVNTSDTVETMFPLLIPAIKEISAQIIENQTTSCVEMSSESRYTETLLLNEIDSIINEAKIIPEATH